MKLTPEQKKKLNSVQEYETFYSLDQLRKSDGGKVLVDTLMKDIANTVEAMVFQYKTLSHTELLGLCAEISVRYNTIRAIENSSKNLAEVVEIALKDNLNNEE